MENYLRRVFGARVEDMEIMEGKRYNMVKIDNTYVCFPFSVPPTEVVNMINQYDKGTKFSDLPTIKKAAWYHAN